MKDTKKYFEKNISHIPRIYCTQNIA